MRKWTRPVGALLIVLCAVNLVVGLMTWFSVDGSALNGKVEKGRHYVGRRGGITEVSETAYTFSYWQDISEMLTLPLGLVGVLLQPFGSRKHPKAAEQVAAADRPRE